MSGATGGALLTEHVLLGASFFEADGGPSRVERYAGEKDAPFADPGVDALLCDLTGATYLLVSDPCGTGLPEAALARQPLAVGECGFSAALAGDGRLLSAPLVLRTGDAEHVLIDASGHGAPLEAWLGFLRSVEAGGVAPYEQASVERADEMLVPLLLAGAGVRAVLADYVSAPDELPEAGTVRQVALDKISTLVARVPLPSEDQLAYVVFVPVPYARILWRSLLSFVRVSPIGHRALRQLVAETLPWEGCVGPEAQRQATGELLRAWGLARAEGGFVGARAV